MTITYSKPASSIVLSALDSNSSYYSSYYTGTAVVSPAVKISASSGWSAKPLAGETLSTAPLSTASSSAQSSKVQKETIASGTKYATDLYIIKSDEPGPVVMIVGGVHGNEVAGYKAASIIKDYSIKKGTLLVLPEANKRAVEIGRRYVTGEGDLNRDFPQTSSDSPDGTLAKAIYNTVKKYDVDWLMDMHEGYDFYKNKSTDSVGQTLIYYPRGSTKEVASRIISELNKGISSSYKEFTLLRYPVKGSLARSTGQFLGVNSFIFETCSKQTLSTRIDYQLQAADIMLKELGMK
ncbi:MAG: succinylglutamate desuccinylase/aspartoacylase family protein [Syntrophomonadaceae bacterium]|nr:succinylglutamate desuccinylase/aspartoacylase family protein [Syntrophomonadaceae bacterium]